MPLFRLAALVAVMGLLQAAPAPYYPGKSWREATPESQGLDSTVLAGLVSNISAKHLNVHSVTVIRHGNVVLDTYFYPYQRNTPHDAGSLTKSITAAIMGIAVDKGRVKTDASLLSFFPGEAPRDPDPQKQKITVADLLTMRAGLDCGFAPGERELEEMRHTPDWVKYTLALPMKYEPGTKFGYCSPGYHMLSSIITSAYHEPEAEFGKRNLFAPLGITDVIWPPDDQGRTHGWGDIHLHPLDFAKIAYLYLHGGTWEGRQIVPAEWIQKSITKQADPGRGAGSGYGYGWWLANTDGLEEFGGNGRGGQRIAVWAAKDMIVIVTGGGYQTNEVMPAIVRSIKSDGALPANAAGTADLKARVADAAKAPAPVAVAPPPAMANKISGVQYEFARNPSRLDGLSLTFNGGPEARLQLRYLGQDFTMPVGLDGVYRLGPNGPFKLPAGAIGHWTSDTDFLLDVNFIANINHYALAIHFTGNGIEVTANEASGLIRNGHLAGTKKA